MANRFKDLNHNSTNVRNNNFKKGFTYLIFYTLWYMIPSIIKKVTLKQFFKPIKYKPMELEKNFLETGKNFQIKVCDKTIQCWKWGEGPLVIFVHGWNGSGIQFVQFFKSFIKASYSVVTFDGPGHGKSQGETSSYFEMTDAVRAIMNYFKDKYIQGIVAHSFGAAAIINSMDKEDCFYNAVLIAPPLKFKDILDKTFDFYGIPRIICRSILNDYEKRFGYNLAKDDPYILLKENRYKLLVIHDRSDKAISYLDTEEVSNQIETIELLTTNGLGHKRILQDQDVINKTLNYISN
jgi:predicted alpha/beta hydrolase family esterase